MKKTIIIALAVLGIASAVKADEVIYENGKFVLVETQESKQEKAEPLRIPDYPVKDKDGIVRYYPCYISKGGKGSAYIIRTSSKTGKQYRAYLGTEETKRLKELLKIED